MLDIIALEQILLDTIVTFVPQFSENNIILLPANNAELPKPYLGIQTLDLVDTGRRINYDVDPNTGNRNVIQHYEWRVRFMAVSDNDANRQLNISSLSLLQSLLFNMNTHVFQYELELNHISFRRSRALIRIPQLLADEWVDQSSCEVIFGLADQTEETVSNIETVDITGNYFRAEDDPDPIIVP